MSHPSDRAIAMRPSVHERSDEVDTQLEALSAGHSEAAEAAARDYFGARDYETGTGHGDSPLTGAVAAFRAGWLRALNASRDDVATTSGLVEHARRELDLIGEDDDTKAGLLKVVQSFADMGHSGSSAFFCAHHLDKLLRFEPLSPLTNDPDEWMHIAEEIGGANLWQSRRNSEAFSHDGGRTYYLLSEREAAGSDETTPLHTAVDR